MEAKQELLERIEEMSEQSLGDLNRAVKNWIKSGSGGIFGFADINALKRVQKEGFIKGWTKATMFTTCIAAIGCFVMWSNNR